VFSEGFARGRKANIDVSKTWTNAFVEKAPKTTGSSKYPGGASSAHFIASPRLTCG